MDGEYAFQSFNELLVFHVLRQQPGLIVDAIHPLLGTSRRRADFRVMAATTGQSVYIEVTMLTADVATDNDVQRAYRLRLAAKLIAYADLRLDLPVIIGADDLAPRRLETKMHEILDRLALPVPPPRPVGWFEGEYEGGVK